EVGAWTYHYSDQGDYTWEQARNYCQTFFTDLVAIQNKQEIEYLNKSLPYHARYYWIGIRKLGGIWTWVGTRKALTKEAENWALGEPNNRRSNQDCVEIYIQRPQQSGKWNDEPCNRKKKALCYQASCQPFPCSQRGECVETIGSYRCECYPGFHGPECAEVVQCAKLEPKGVHMNCSHPYGDFSYNSTCEFGCQEGFERQGMGILRCLPSQEWSANIPICTAIKCPLLAGPKRGWVNCSHPHSMFTSGDSLGNQNACKIAVKGKTYLGKFNLSIYTISEICSPIAAITCPVLSAPEQGELNCSHLHGDFAFGSTCAFSCQMGFALVGPESRECTATGKWTGDAPRCEAVVCPVLSAPDQGEMHCSHLHGNFTFGSTCAFSCQKGFALMGPESHECTATGTWTGDIPHCEAIACPVLRAPDQGDLNCSHLHGDFTFGSVCAFSCHKGFVLMGPESRECAVTGTWTEDTPHCEAITCPVLSAPDQGELNCSHLHGGFTFGSTCAFSCHKGFVLMGPESRECTVTGTWTEDTPHCEGRAAATTQDFTFGSTCAFSCQMGFALMGSDSRECTATGTWTGDAPRCEGRAAATAQGVICLGVTLRSIKCSALTIPKMGQAACSHLHGDFAFGSTCAFSCHKGFVLMGPESRECTATGTWTGGPTHCKAISCPVLAPPSRGQLSCSHVHGNFTYNSTCTFSCEEGFVRMGAEMLQCEATGNWTREPPVCAG
ncbi:LYAM3 protein, partial [Aphelocoma coerulescens]|nr:LYAM3 protein [Aphelocoma coerulescens]